MHALALLCINHQTKCEVHIFTISKDTIGAKNGSRDPDHASLGGGLSQSACVQNLMISFICFRDIIVAQKKDLSAICCDPIQPICLLNLTTHSVSRDMVCADQNLHGSRDLTTPPLRDVLSSLGQDLLLSTCLLNLKSVSPPTEDMKRDSKCGNGVVWDSQGSPEVIEKDAF